MTNEELIEKLNKFPKDAQVLIPVPESKEIDKLKDIDIITYNVERNQIGLIWSNRK